ncbi:MAG: hypothetical protein ISS01_03265 [Nanoarchaeota archaeon]|nr:hypothetical protein [Nanoarchaeota archaeon]
MSLVERVVEIGREAFHFIIEPSCEEGHHYFRPEHRERRYCAKGGSCQYAEDVPKGLEEGYCFDIPVRRKGDPTQITKVSSHYCNK